ncbi:MAG: hypothetical protein CSA76_06370 [Spirochaetales bacterium]|nr:MAG: hypothetical protein CSA76_06370 [Spirochaetales bacterium]
MLEKALHGDVAVLQAKVADKAGNLIFDKSARNFNPLMATACKTVLVEVDQVVETGTLDPDCIHTPGLFVDYIVLTEGAK